MNAKQLKKVQFEQDDYEIPQALEYYVGLEGPTIETVSHPDNLWSILDRLETMVMDNSNLEDDQQEFLFHFLGKWKKEIEPYCVRLESE